MGLMGKPRFLTGAFLISTSIVASWRELPRNVDVVCFYGVSWFLSLTWDFRGILGELFCKSLICLGKRQIHFGDDKPELQRQRQLQLQNTRILRLAQNDDIKQTVTRTTTEADPYGMQTRTARATGAAVTIWG